jgi:hypothetical protein
MPFVSTIIARLLALQDRYLGQWVDVSAYTLASPNGCWQFDVINASINPCGQEFLSNLTYIRSIIEGSIIVIPAVLSGLRAF